MEPYSLPQLQSRLAELQSKLDQTSSNSKRFKLGLKIDECRALIEHRRPKATTSAAAAAAAKKRTSTSSTFSSIAPLRLTALELAARAERAARFENDKTKQQQQQKRPGGNLTLRDVRRRAESIAAEAAASSPPPPAAAAAAFGKSEALEKSYLRLTSLPTVADVRPPKVLAEALGLLKKGWREEGAAEEGGGGASSSSLRYDSYFREQLKSIRQDLVVQSVRSPLAVDVYETHARIALQSGDIAEFNQCQTALEELYREAKQGGEAAAAAVQVRARARARAAGASSSSSSSSSLCLRNRAEFSAYKILYSQAMALSSSRPSSSSSSSSAINLAMRSVRQADREHPFVRSALEAAALARAGDARGLAAALEGAPRMSPCMLDLLLPHARGVAARALVAGWRGGARGGAGEVSSLSDAARLLGLSSPLANGDEEGREEGDGGGDEQGRAAAAAELLRAAGAVVDVAAGTVSVPRSSSGSSRSSSSRDAGAVAAAAPAPLSKKSKDKKRGRGDDAGDKKNKEKREKKEKKKR